MPIDFRAFKKQIESEGYLVEQTRRGHFRVRTPQGNVLVFFAVSHGSRTKGGEVWDSYVKEVMKAIKNHKLS